VTTLNEAREAVYDRFVVQWGVTTPIVFENEQFAAPANDSWVRLSVRGNVVRAQETLGSVGNRKFRSTGMVFVQVYTRADVGLKQGDDLSKQARDVFDAVSFSGLDFLAGLVRETGVDGKWQQHLVEVNFDFDETK
jgi:hypothetical protein